MEFDEKKYTELLIAHRRNGTNPEDLLERYAITLPASDAAITEQVKRVREYWNKIGLGQSRASGGAKWCRTQDELLRKDRDVHLESAAWWQGRQSARDADAEASIQTVVDDLRQNYGALKVVTSGTLDKFAAKFSLTGSQAELAAKRAGLTVVDKKVTLPDAPPFPSFKQLLQYMNECKAVTVPALVHPDSGPFRIVERYKCVADSGKQLDAVAVEAQTAEVQKRGVSGADNARVSALRMLRGANLHEVTLYHLVALAQDAPSSTSAKSILERAGVESTDAATIAVLLAERKTAASASGLDKVKDLLEQGQLRDATAAAAALSGAPEMVAEAQQLVAAARARLDQLLAEAKKARLASDEALADQRLKDAERISAEDAAAERALTPLAPPTQLRATEASTEVRLFWQRGVGHDESTRYVVGRTLDRAPTAPADGEQVYNGPGDGCADRRAPVARTVRYGVFALADGRPPSRPATAEVTLLPPVWGLTAEVGTATVTLSWSAHQNAEVRVTRATSGAAPVSVPVTGSGCRLSGLPEGVAQHFEVVAVYRGPGGAELRSGAEPISATPRAEARPVPKLRTSVVESGRGLRVRMTWPRVDNSEVKIIRCDAQPPWPFGTVITHEQMVQAGREVAGQDIGRGTENGLEADLPAGVHYLVPLSIGGAGIMVGRTASVAVTDPVRNLVATPFSDYATVSWEWPETSQLAEVTWELGGDTDFYQLSLAEYTAKGGARVPLGAGPCKVEVRAVIMAGNRAHLAPAAEIVVHRIVQLPIAYHVSGLPSLGPFGGHAKKVVFTAEQPCTGVRVRMIAFPGPVMPTRATDGLPILDTTLTLVPGVPTEHKVVVPKAIKRPFWVRCFVLDGPGRLVDPPIAQLKEK